MTYELFFSNHRTMWGVRCVEPDGDCKTIFFNRDLCGLFGLFTFDTFPALRVTPPNECTIPNCRRCKETTR